MSSDRPINYDFRELGDLGRMINTALASSDRVRTRIDPNDGNKFVAGLSREGCKVYIESETEQNSKGKVIAIKHYLVVEKR